VLRKFRAVAVLAVFALGACRAGEPVATIKLDGTPRLPDRQGIVTDVSLEKIAIDGESFTLSRKLRCFMTYTLAAMPVLQTKDAYVHIGLRSKKVVWVALVARTLPGPDGQKQAFYQGTVKAFSGGRATFVDGTVLPVASGVSLPASGTKVQVRIDPKAGRVVEVQGA
jgi:hypothetical protein